MYFAEVVFFSGNTECCEFIRSFLNLAAYESSSSGLTLVQQRSPVIKVETFCFSYELILILFDLINL